MSASKVRINCLERLEVRRMLTTYYVATSGNDASAGSSGAPWKTLQYAADHVGAGDTVVVRPGSYVGFDLRTSGTPSQRITFSAENGAVINQVNPRTNRDGINLENASYITIQGFTLNGTNDPATSRAGIRVVGDGFDTGVFSKGVIVRNNKADRWGQWGMLTGFCDDIIIESNEFSRSAQQHGLYFSNSGDRPIIRYNRLWGNANCGLHMNADIETGDTRLPAVDGIITGALVEGNIIYGNGGGSAFASVGGSAINCDGVRNSRFINNLLYDNHATGIALYQIDAAAPAINNVVANNTVINASDARHCLLIVDGATGTTVFNNIFFNLNPSSVRGSIELSADSTAGFVSDYNLLDPRFSHGETMRNLSQWRSLTGGDSHSSSLTNAQMQALFTSYAGRDFSLAAGSAAIDAGTASMNNGGAKLAPNVDLSRVHRPSGAAHDVGAYERESGPFATNVDGVLHVLGTIGNDTISVAVAGDVLSITRNGSTMTFARSSVTAIEVYADAGNDGVTVGAGVLGCYINGGAGNDTLRGGDDRDTIAAGAGKDLVYGGAGDDRIAGNQAPDRLYGEGGKDRIYGGDGDDLIDGGSHNDQLFGEAGLNTLYGQGGNDLFYTRNSSIDRLYGGSGIDGCQSDSTLDLISAVENRFT